MDHLEELSQKLENFKFVGPSLKLHIPLPPSVKQYLSCKETPLPNDPNQVIDSLITTPSSTSKKNDQLLNQKVCHEESQIETSPRKRNNKSKVNFLKYVNTKYSSNNKQTQSASETFENHKNFYAKYMPLVEVEKGLKNKQLFEGVIRISQKCTSEAYVPSPDKSKDILINSIKLRNRALDGDKVVVRILNKSEWRNPDREDCQRTGEVVYITQKKEENRIIVGHLLIERGIAYRFSTLVPRDQRLPRLFVNTSTWPTPIDVREGTKESVDLFYAILSIWDTFRTPIGILKGILGQSGEINTETRGLLLTYKIEEAPYPKNIDKYFPPPFSIDEELKLRNDFRKQCIFSIDPPTAKDLDDALSCVLLPNGNYKIGIHISDVSHFVKHNTLLDKIAKELATSIYLVQKVYHMLPPALTMMASLLPGTDKLAVSVTLEMTPYAEVISHAFSRSIIQSCAQLHYSHAQIFLENPENKNWDESEFPTVHNGYTISDCATAVCHLHKLASIMRKRRFDNGALAINQPKLAIEIDKATCEPLSYSLYILHESNWLIEEFMLLANTLVAEHLKTHFPSTAMLRNHQPPDSVAMEKALKILNAYGINIDASSAGSIHKSKALYCRGENDYRDIIISNILSKPMVRAEYCVICPEINMAHYALNVPYYTHFTSPIRRYPDLVVHRMLISLLTGKSIMGYDNPSVIDEIAKNCNDKKNNAKKASEASSEIYAACLIGKLGGREEYAMVLDVKEHYFEATVTSMNINVRVYVNTKSHYTDILHKSSQYSIVDNKPILTIVWDEKQNITQTIQLFNTVKLKLTKKKNCLTLKAILIRDN